MTGSPPLQPQPVTPFRPPPAAVTGRGLAVLAGWYATLLAFVVLWIGQQPARNTDGTCEGLGFGCTLSPRDGAVFVVVLYGLPALLISALVSVITLAVAVAAGARSGLVAGNIAAFVGIVLVGVAGLAMLAAA